MASGAAPLPHIPSDYDSSDEEFFPPPHPYAHCGDKAVQKILDNAEEVREQSLRDVEETIKRAEEKQAKKDQEYVPSSTPNCSSD